MPPKGADFRRLSGVRRLHRPVAPGRQEPPTGELRESLSRFSGAPLGVRRRRRQCCLHGSGERRALSGVRRFHRPVAPGRQEPPTGKARWGREDSNLRRLSRRVYSPLPLAARALPREKRHIVATPRCGLVERPPRPTWRARLTTAILWPLSSLADESRHASQREADFCRLRTLPLAARALPRGSAILPAKV